MPSKDDVRRRCLAHENVVEDGSYRYRIGSRDFVWPYPERIHPKRPRVTRFDVFVVWLGTDADKHALLAGEPDLFFTTDHYNGFPAVLVRLDTISEDRLVELIADSIAAATDDVARPCRRRSRTQGGSSEE